MNISASDNIVQISGLNSAEFLQGQITNDINLVSDNAMLDSAICSVKGRVIAVFRILKAENSFYIFLNHSVAEKFVNYLEKYSVFYKANIKILDYFPKSIEIIPELTWKQNCIDRGFVDMNSSISESYTPHELNYQDLELINFKKGCFTGQEVIARMHYRGKLKFGLAKYHIHDDSFLGEFEFVFNESGKKIGQVVSCTKNIGLIAMKDKSYLKEKFFKENSEEICFLNIEST